MVCAGSREGGKDSCEVRRRGAGVGGCPGPGRKPEWRWGQKLQGKDLLLAFGELVFVR